MLSCDSPLDFYLPLIKFVCVKKRNMSTCLLLCAKFEACPMVSMSQSDCSLVGFSQGLSVSQQCFSLTTNQHQSGLSAQKHTSEQAEYLNRQRLVSPDGVRVACIVTDASYRSVETLTSCTLAMCWAIA